VCKHVCVARVRTKLRQQIGSQGIQRPQKTEQKQCGNWQPALIRASEFPCDHAFDQNILIRLGRGMAEALNLRAESAAKLQ